MENNIYTTLSKLGVSPSIKGYYYVEEAVKYVLENGPLVKTTAIYYHIAKKVNSTYPCVERCIRHAVTQALNRGKMDFIDLVFGRAFTPEGRITNGDFIFSVANYVKENTNE